MGRISGFYVAAALIIGSVVLAAFLISLAPEPASRELSLQIPFAQTGRIVAGSGPIPVYGAGTVRPGAEVDIAPQVGGKVVWVDPGFKSGGRVQAGQTIFRIEATDYQHQVQVVEADLAARQAALLEAEEQAVIARAEYTRFSERQGDTDSPSTASPLALREPQLRAAQAALKRDEARVANANLALSRTRITAPFDGVVRDESVDAGQILNAGQTVGRIFAADAVEVVVPLSDADSSLIPGLWELQAGDTRRQVFARVIARYGDGSYAWDGYVDRGEASLDEQTRTIDVIVRVPDPFSTGVPLDGSATIGGSPPLLVGEFVKVQIQGVALENYYRVPRAALQPGNEVWVVNIGGIVSIVSVRVVQRADDEAYVIGALEAGQAVITGGIQYVTPGMRVLTGDGSLQ